MTPMLGIALALLAPGAPVDNPAERLELRAYSIPLLVHGRVDAYAPPLGFFPIVPDIATPGEHGQWVTARRRFRVEGQSVVQLVTRLLGEETAPGSSCDLLEDVILASQPIAKHDAIRQALTGVQAAVCRSYVVRVAVLAPESIASLRSVVLSAADVRRLCESEGANVSDVIVESGQRAVVGAAAETSYVSDYNVEVANRSKVADPEVSVARDGVSVGVRARYAGAGFVELETTSDVVLLDRPILPFRTQLEEIGSIQLPTFSVTRVGASVVVPDGGGIVLGCLGSSSTTGSNAREGGRAAILVSATPVSAEPPRSLVRVLDVDVLLRRPRRFAASTPSSLSAAIEAVVPPSVTGASQESGAPGDAAWEREETHAILDMPSVVNILTAAAGEEPSGEIGTELGPSLYAVTLESAGADKLVAVTESLMRSMRRGTTFDAAVVKLPAATRRRLDPVRGTLADDAAETAPGGKGATVVVRAATACLDRGSAALAVGRERALVSDYNPEIAQDAAISDPIVVATFTGLALELVPRRGPDGSFVDVRVNGAFTRGPEAPETSTSNPVNVGALQQSSVTTFDVSGTWLLTPGRWTYRVLEDSPEGSLALALRCETRDE